MFVFEDMAIDAILVVAILISAFIFVYIVTAIAAEWRSYRRARSADRRQLAARQALERASGTR